MHACLPVIPRGSHPQDVLSPSSLFRRFVVLRREEVFRQDVRDHPGFFGKDLHAVGFGLRFVDPGRPLSGPFAAAIDRFEPVLRCSNVGVDVRDVRDGDHEGGQFIFEVGPEVVEPKALSGGAQIGYSGRHW